MKVVISRNSSFVKSAYAIMSSKRALMENFTLVTRGDATVAQRAQRPTHGECDCGCAALFRGLVLDYKYTTGLNTLQVYIHYMEGERGVVHKKSINM